MGEEAIVAIDGGLLRGRRRGGILELLGVPYGAAPRFAAPAALETWSGVREATSPGPAAPQPRRDVARFTHGELPPTDEQCLSVNVFAPEGRDGLPVLVWIHGGGFAVGHAGASIYHGGRLALAGDAVVVTVGYRLGDLGWLWHPELAAQPGGPAGNWGMLDVLAALEWVQRNAASFGGDPSRVTLAGQSAGALIALDLLSVSAASGLFARVIAQSPPFLDLAQPPGTAVPWAQALSAACGGAGAFDREALLAIPADAIVAAHERLLDDPRFRGTRGGALPTLDAALLPTSPAQEPAAALSVDVLIGHTAQEGTFFFGSPWRPAPPPDRIAGIVGHLVEGEEPEAVLARYRARAAAARAATEDARLLVDIATDAMIAAPIQRWAAARAAAGGRVFRYRFDHPGAGPQLGATHTAEVPLLFGTWRDGGPGERLGGQAANAPEVSAELVRAWHGFMHASDPGWRAVTATEPELHAFGSAAGVARVGSA